MDIPQLVVNFKTYANATGVRAVELARIHEKVAQETGVNIAIAVQAVDLARVANEVKIPVLAQHFDVADQGAYTGYVTPYSLKEVGAAGSLLNHAERRLSLDDIEEAVDLARRLALFTIVCVDTPYAGKAAAELGPNAVCVEPPELIGGDVSVCTAQPQVVRDAVAMIGKNKVLVGAGVRSKQDVQAAIGGGARGVLLSSGITKALDPEAVLCELVQGVLHPNAEAACGKD